MYQQYIDIIKERLKPKRFVHSMNVADCARGLAEKYGADPQKAYLSGLLHDICKNDTEEKQLQMIQEFDIILDNVQSTQKKLWHAVLGAEYIKRVVGIDDKEIIDAVRYHTTARAGMTLLDKILYLADIISEERDFDGVDELRAAADVSLDNAITECLRFSVVDLCNSLKPVHIDTIAAYNEYVGR